MTPTQLLFGCFDFGEDMLPCQPGKAMRPHVCGCVQVTFCPPPGVHWSRLGNTSVLRQCQLDLHAWYGHTLTCTPHSAVPATCASHAEPCNGTCRTICKSDLGALLAARVLRVPPRPPSLIWANGERQQQFMYSSYGKPSGPVTIGVQRALAWGQQVRWEQDRCSNCGGGYGCRPCAEIACPVQAPACCTRAMQRTACMVACKRWLPWTVPAHAGCGDTSWCRCAPAFLPQRFAARTECG